MDATRERRMTWGVSLALAVLAGVASVAQPWSGLARFDSTHLVPLVAGLSLVRMVGAHAASVVACLHVTTWLRAGMARSRGLVARAAVFPLLAAVPVTLVAIASASVVTLLLGGLGPRAFVERLLLADPVHGLVRAAVLGVVPAAWVLVAPRILARVRGTGAALATTWLVGLIASAVVGGIVTAAQGLAGS